MKKAISMILAVILVCMSTPAFAYEWGIIIAMFDVSADVFGAKTLTDVEKTVVPLSSTDKNDTLVARFDGYVIMITVDDNNTVTSGTIVLQEESAAMDFLLACMSMISAFGKVDSTAFGMLLLQTAKARNGERNDPYHVSADYFTVIPASPNDVCIFQYTNVLASGQWY